MYRCWLPGRAVYCILTPIASLYYLTCLYVYVFRFVCTRTIGVVAMVAVLHEAIRRRPLPPCATAAQAGVVSPCIAIFRAKADIFSNHLCYAPSNARFALERKRDPACYWLSLSNAVVEAARKSNRGPLAVNLQVAPPRLGTHVHTGGVCKKVVVVVMLCKQFRSIVQ